MNRSAASILAILALVLKRMEELGVEFRADPAVRSVQAAMTPRHYAAGDRMEFYLDAELVNANSIACWLEFREETGSWIVESSVRRNTADGEDEVVGLPSRFAVDDDELVAEIDGASAALIRAARMIDLSTM